jgi:hypothetical protein
MTRLKITGETTLRELQEILLGLRGRFGDIGTADLQITPPRDSTDHWHVSTASLGGWTDAPRATLAEAVEAAVVHSEEWSRRR